MARPVSSRLSWRRRHSSQHTALLHPVDPAILSLVKSLVSATKDIAGCKKPQVCQRSNTRNLSRRASVLSLLFEEVRDSGVWIPPSALASFRQLRVIFRNIKALVDGCRDSSNLLLLMEQDTLADQFHHLTLDIANALAGLPCELLEVSEETREQVTLVQRQASKTERYVDPDEKRLQSEVLSVMADFERQISPDPEVLGHIFLGLQFNDATDCERELLLLEKEKERLRSNEQIAEIPDTNSLISFVRYSRCVLYGLASEEQQVTISSACRKYNISASRKLVFLREEDGGASIPDDFRCPISLELMVDPVIVATGQTYDRAAISRWLQEGHTTCPKSGQRLFHNHLIPNANLRRLITQWCRENDFVLEPAESKPAKPERAEVEVPCTRAAREATRLTAEFLVRKLAEGSTREVRRQAAYELRLMAKEGTENRASVAGAGAIPRLVELLGEEGDARAEENAVTALLNLSINEENQAAIMAEEGALEGIVRVLAEGSGEGRENAAAALFSLTRGCAANRVAVGAKAGAIEGLVSVLLSDAASARGRRDAAATLFNLALHGHLAPALAAHGAVPALLATLADPLVAPDSLAALAILARRPATAAALQAAAQSALPALLRHAVEGASSKAQENALAVLLAACSPSPAESDSTSHVAAAFRRKLRHSSDLIPALQHLLSAGTPRAQRKAASFLRVLQLYH